MELSSPVATTAAPVWLRVAVSSVTPSVRLIVAEAEGAVRSWRVPVAMLLVPVQAILAVGMLKVPPVARTGPTVAVAVALGLMLGAAVADEAPAIESMPRAKAPAATPASIDLLDRIALDNAFPFDVSASLLCDVGLEQTHCSDSPTRSLSDPSPVSTAYKRGGPPRLHARGLLPGRCEQSSHECSGGNGTRNCSPEAHAGSGRCPVSERRIPTRLEMGFTARNGPDHAALWSRPTGPDGRVWTTGPPGG